MYAKSSHFVGLVALAGTLLLAACGANSATTPATQANSPTVGSSLQSTSKPAGGSQATASVGAGASAPTQATSPADLPVAQSTSKPAVGGEAGGEAGGVEAALVNYTDSAQHFSINHPGPWTQDTTVSSGVVFTGGDSRMQLEFAQPATNTDALAFATNDVAAVTQAFPGFKQVALAPSTEVPNAVVLGFEANATSGVTGKAYTAQIDRYYMPLADSRIAILTVVSPSARYDHEGVRDIALTFKMTK